MKSNIRKPHVVMAEDSITYFDIKSMELAYPETVWLFKMEAGMYLSGDVLWCYKYNKHKLCTTKPTFYRMPEDPDRVFELTKIEFSRTRMSAMVTYFRLKPLLRRLEGKSDYEVREHLKL